MNVNPSHPKHTVLLTISVDLSLCTLATYHQVMAVHSYLKTWGQSHLINTFDDMNLDSFLAISYKQAVDGYGQYFAKQHLNLCNTLRKALWQKWLLDREEPRCSPETRTPDIDGLVSNMSCLSVKDRVGVSKRPFPLSRLTEAIANSKERVSVKLKQRLDIVMYNREYRRQTRGLQCCGTKTCKARRFRNRGKSRQISARRTPQR